MKTEHTKGPWHVYNSVFGPVVDTEDNIPVAKLHHKCVGPHEMDPANDTWPNMANARLIAAAPDLLEACELAMHPMSDPEEVREAMIAAIAKAKGEQ